MTILPIKEQLAIHRRRRFSDLTPRDLNDVSIASTLFCSFFFVFGLCFPRRTTRRCDINFRDAS